MEEEELLYFLRCLVSASQLTDSTMQLCPPLPKQVLCLYGIVDNAVYVDLSMGRNTNIVRHSPAQIP